MITEDYYFKKKVLNKEIKRHSSKYEILNFNFSLKNSFVEQLIYNVYQLNEKFETSFMFVLNVFF